MLSRLLWIWSDTLSILNIRPEPSNGTIALRMYHGLSHGVRTYSEVIWDTCVHILLAMWTWIHPGNTVKYYLHSWHPLSENQHANSVIFIWFKDAWKLYYGCFTCVVLSAFQWHSTARISIWTDTFRAVHLGWDQAGFKTRSERDPRKEKKEIPIQRLVILHSTQK